MSRGRPKKVTSDNSTLKLSKSDLAKREAEKKALEEFKEINDETPNYLDHMGKLIYRDIVSLMRGNLPVSELDKTMIATFSMTYSHWRKLNRDILKNGTILVTYDDYGNEKRTVNPAYNAMLKAQNEMRQLASQLGLTMNSRMQLVVPDAEEEEDAFLELIKGS